MKHNDEDRLTPEERAVIEAALAWFDDPDGTPDTGDPLVDAVAAYRRATAPPEPFEARLGIYSACMNILSVREGEPFRFADQVWLCTVTPTERVR